jgi:hypothetical protein
LPTESAIVPVRLETDTAAATKPFGTETRNVRLVEVLEPATYVAVPRLVSRTGAVAVIAFVIATVSVTSEPSGYAPAGAETNDTVGITPSARTDPRVVIAPDLVRAFPIESVIVPPVSPVMDTDELACPVGTDTLNTRLVAVLKLDTYAAFPMLVTRTGEPETVTFLLVFRAIEITAPAGYDPSVDVISDTTGATASTTGPPTTARVTRVPVNGFPAASRIVAPLAV